MKTFYKSVIILSIAAFLGESLEFIINLILAKELGEHGMGLYMSIFPSLFLVVVLASLELPISISKFLAEEKREKHYELLRYATKLACLVSVVCMIGALIIFPFIPIFNAYHPLIKWLFILIIPITSFTSIARGYFMGVQQMGKIAVSNFLRKAVQLAFLFFIFHWFHYSTEMSLLISFCVVIASEIAVTIYLCGNYYLQYRLMKRAPFKPMSSNEARKKLLAVSLPTTGLRIFHSLAHAIQPFLTKAALIAGGITAFEATEMYGMLAGVALTIGFFPAFIGHSLTIVLIPSVSEAYAKKDLSKVLKLLQQIIFITGLYGIPAVIVIYYFAEPLTGMFFQSSAAHYYLQLLWPYFLFHYFVGPLQAFLIGLGLVKEAFYQTVWSHVVGFSLIYFLGSMEQLQIGGVIIGMNTAAILQMLLHYLTICKKIDLNVFLMNQSIKTES